MRAGSLPWLIRHDLRVEWRELSAQWSTSLAVALGLAALIVLTFLWLLALNLFGPLFEAPFPAELNILTGVLVLGVLPIAVMLGINQSIKAVFERNDLDLLLASPLPTRTVFAGRLLGVAGYIFAALGIFLLPLAVAALITGVPRLLGIVPVLIVLALTGAALGMLLTLLLVRLIGARRARTVGQVVGALSGALVVLATQLPLLTGEGQITNENFVRIVALFQPGGVLAGDSPVWWPGRTLLLDPLPTVVTLAAAGLLMLLAVVSLHRWFLLGAGSPVTTSGRRRPATEQSLRFGRSRSLWRTMLAKEWRLLIRDPYLTSQTLLQVVYMIPLGVVLFYNRDPSGVLPLGPALAAAVTVLTGTLAASLCRIVMSGEEAMDLLVGSPVSAVQIRQAKRMAALVPVWVLAAPLVIGLLLFEPLAGAVASVAVAVTGLSAAFVRLNNPVRAGRQDLFRRQGQGDQLLNFIDGFVPLAWAGTVWLLLVSNPWAVATLALALALLAVAWQRGKRLWADYAEIATE